MAEVSAGKTEKLGTGIICRGIHLHVCWPMLAVGWDPIWGWRPEQLPVSSSSLHVVLTSSQHSDGAPKSRHLRLTRQNSYHLKWRLLGHLHCRHRSSQTQRETTSAPPLMHRVSTSCWMKSIWEGGSSGNYLREYTLPNLLTRRGETSKSFLKLDAYR